MTLPRKTPAPVTKIATMITVFVCVSALAGAFMIMGNPLAAAIAAVSALAGLALKITNQLVSDSAAPSLTTPVPPGQLDDSRQEPISPPADEAASTDPTGP
jgi:hypothetical protein